MTIDDNSSIYVGGLPYDATEESLREAFDLYGGIVAVKIHNDRGIGGKCYAFVTFRNPRSAADAISDMNGRDIGGRIIKVNEVKPRGGRANFNREAFRRGDERGMGWGRARDRERDYDLDRGRYRDRNRDRSRDREIDRERGYEHSRDREESRDRHMERDFDRDRDIEEHEQENRNRGSGFERDRDLDWDRDRDVDRVSDSDNRDRYRNVRKRNGDQRSSEPSSESSGYGYEIKEQLEISIQKLEELQKEIEEMQGRLEGKRQLVLDLQKKSQILEISLTSAKKFSSQRQMQLFKLHKCLMQVNDYSGKLKSSEHELQSLVDLAMIDVEINDDVTS